MMSKFWHIMRRAKKYNLGGGEKEIWFLNQYIDPCAADPTITTVPCELVTTRLFYFST